MEKTYSTGTYFQQYDLDIKNYRYYKIVSGDIIFSYRYKTCSDRLFVKELETVLLYTSVSAVDDCKNKLYKYVNIYTLKENNKLPFYLTFLKYVDESQIIDKNHTIAKSNDVLNRTLKLK